MKQQRKGFVLLTSVLLVTFLIAVTAELANVSGFAAVIQNRRHATLQHELAVDSAVLWVADALSGAEQGRIVGELDRVGRAVLNFRVGDLEVEAVLRDDGAKFNPRHLQRADQELLLSRVLGQLGAQAGLPHCVIAPRPVLQQTPAQPGNVYFSLDQLLASKNPGELWRVERESTPVWSDVVTLCGDGRIDLRRAQPEVLEAALAGLQPGLGRAMLAMRPSDRSRDFLGAALDRVPAELRQHVAQRVGFNLLRYSLELTTGIRADRRQWYVVARIADGKTEMLHRSQVTW